MQLYRGLHTFPFMDGGVQPGATMDDLAIRLGIKLLIFCTLFVGLSVGAKALRRRPIPGKTDKGPPPGWYDPPPPDPKPGPPSSRSGGDYLSESDLDRLNVERAPRPAPGESAEVSAVAAQAIAIRPLAARVSGTRAR